MIFKRKATDSMDMHYDVIVVGGGPAGLSAAINSAIRDCRTLVLDSDTSLLKRAERIDNYLGLPGVKGNEMMASFVTHAQSLGVAIEKAMVSSILPAGMFYVNSKNIIYTANAIVLGLGATRAKSFNGEDEYLGRGVSYCATCDGMLYRGRSVVVVGLCADAPDEANYLADIGVSVVYLGDTDRPNELKPDIEWHRGTVASIEGTDTVSRVVLTDETMAPIEADGVFILRDAIAPTAMMSGLESGGGYISVDSDMMTNIPGVFACGDCTGPPLQISKATGQGLIAGQAAARYTKANT